MHRSNQIHSLFADWERVLCFSDRPSLSRKSGRKKTWRMGWSNVQGVLIPLFCVTLLLCSLDAKDFCYKRAIRALLNEMQFHESYEPYVRFDKIPYRRKARSPVVMKWIYFISLKRTTLPQLKPITPIVGLIFRLARAVPVEWLHSIIGTWTSVRWVVGMPGETLS